MLNTLNCKDLVCLDIETVPQFINYASTPAEVKNLWLKKSRLLKKSEEDADEILYQRAGIYAEFGKIICISAGYFENQVQERKFCLRSFAQADEYDLLTAFKNFLEGRNSTVILAAHNGKEFDFPYISRRMIINGISLPSALDHHGKKPWEINHLDTLELWKFGDYKNYTPLNLLAYILGIKSPKDDIDGSMVAEVYYKENQLERIVEYCQKDVLTVMQIILKLRNEKLLQDNEIFSTDFLMTISALDK